MQKGKVLVVALFASLAAAGGVAAPPQQGGVSIDARYRVESVSDDALPERALASTLRLRLGYLSPGWQGWQSFIELEDVRELGADSYNDTKNGKTGFPVVADPEDFELNQAYLSRMVGDGALRFGRQRINIANQRFFGAVGFRQNEQTFDAAVLELPASRGLLQVGLISRVNRIYGAHHPELAATDTRTVVLDFEQTLGIFKAAAYAHLIDFPDSPAASHRNTGVRAAATHGRFDWRAEYASQGAYRNGVNGIGGDYYRLDLGWQFELLHVRLAREVLGGDGRNSFQTPFATLHAFNGAADKFAVTPPGGLVDDAAEAQGHYRRWQYGASFHRFGSDAGSVRYGDEFAAFASHPIGDRVTARLEAAAYSAETFASDTSKVWFTVQARF